MNQIFKDILSQSPLTNTTKMNKYSLFDYINNLPLSATDKLSLKASIEEYVSERLKDTIHELGLKIKIMERRLEPSVGRQWRP
jgi:hypothetical protein